MGNAVSALTTDARRYPANRLFAPVARRLARVTLSIFAVGVAWVALAPADAVPAFVILPPVIALACVPAAIRRWAPGLYLGSWLRWLQIEAWKRTTSRPPTRAGAEAWLCEHPERTMTTVSALGILGRLSEERDLLADIRPDSPIDRWRLAYARAALAIASGGEPDLAAVESAAALVPDDVSATARAGYLAYLNAWNDSRLGGNGADLMTLAAKAIDLTQVPAEVRMGVWLRRYRGPSVCALILIALWAVLR